jgi:hypothetical protein
LAWLIKEEISNEIFGDPMADVDDTAEYFRQFGLEESHRQYTEEQSGAHVDIRMLQKIG